MTDTNVIKLAQPGTFTDSLTEILRDGQCPLTQAVETEVADSSGDTPISGPRRAASASCVRAVPEREIMTGIGPVAVRQPRVRDREICCGRCIFVQPEQFRHLTRGARRASKC